MTKPRPNQSRVPWIVGNLISSAMMGGIAAWLFHRSSGFLGYALATILLVAALIALINAFVNPGRPGQANENSRPAGGAMQHPSLGELTFDGEGIWTGETIFGDQRVEIAVSGDSQGPDRVLAERLVAHTNTMPRVQEKVVEFMNAQFAAVKGADIRDFEIDSLDFLWAERPDYFMVRLRSQKDPEAIWKVEFVDDAPRHLSRDD